MSKKYDVVVLGGGPGGYVAAIKAAQLGKSCALIEKEKLGGVCLNWGCIPTKSLLRNAEIVSHLFEGSRFGFEVDTKSIKLDYAKAHQRSRQVSARLVSGVEYLMKKNKITVINDEAVFSAPKKLLLSKTKEEVTADNIIIAVGARPNHLKGIDFSSEYILDSKKALQLTKAPKSVVILGAGAIGMEFATVWHAYGAEVTVIEMMPDILPNEDAEISKEARKQYEKKGIKIITNTKADRISAEGKQVRVALSDGSKLVSQYVLVSAGVVPNTDRINIEKTGIKLGSRGFIEVDNAMRTNVNGIYAIGDITGRVMLAHVASAQGIVAASELAGIDAEPIVYENIPKCAYCVPETASVGLTEQQAKDRGLQIVRGVFPFAANGKAISYGEPEGFVKVLAGKKHGEILGIHMIGPHVTEMIAAAVGYLQFECTIDELENLIHPHPTLSEAVMEASHVAGGHGIHI